MAQQGTLRLLSSPPSRLDAPAALQSPLPTAVRRQHLRGASVASQVFSRYLQVTIRPTLTLWSYTSRLPWPVGLIDKAGGALRPIEGTTHQPVRLQNCDAEWLQGPGAGAKNVILYLHGGAFLCCGIRTHRRLASRISAVSQSAVLMVDYRMLPDATVSDSIADGVDAYRWLLDNGYSGEQITVAGDSAGGYLSFAVPLAIKAAGLPMPAAIVAISPLTEMDPTHKLQGKNAGRCTMFPKSAVPEMTKIAMRQDQAAMSARGQAARVCPVDADLRDMPPTLIQAGSHEMLLEDAELMAERLAQAGVPCELQVWDRQPHVFPVFADVIPEGVRAIAEIGRFIRTAHGSLLTSVG